MDWARNLPSIMCPGCKFYSFHEGDSSPHRCSDDGAFYNGSKCGQDPNRDGTSMKCNYFKSR